MERETDREIEGKEQTSLSSPADDVEKQIPTQPATQLVDVTLSTRNQDASSSGGSCKLAGGTGAATVSTDSVVASLNLVPRPDEIMKAVRQKGTCTVIVVCDGRDGRDVAGVTDSDRSGSVGDCSQNDVNAMDTSVDKVDDVSKKEESNKKSRKGRKRKDDSQASLSYDCKHCGKRYKSKGWLNQHIRSQHQEDGSSSDALDESSDEDKAQKFVCEHCSKVYRSMLGLQYHLNTQHQDVASANDNGKTTRNETIGGSYSCEHCNKEYKSLNGLKYHLQTNHLKRSNDEASGSDRDEAKKDTEVLGTRRAARKALRLFASINDQAGNGHSKYHSGKAEHRSSKVKPDPGSYRIPHGAQAPRVRTATAAEVAELHAAPIQPVQVSTRNWKEVFTPEQLAIVEKALAAKKRLRCFNKDCQKVLTTAVGFAYHHQRCGKAKAQLLCELCHAVYTSHAGLDYHMRAVHAPGRVDDSPPALGPTRSAWMVSPDTTWSASDGSHNNDSDDIMEEFVQDKKRQQKKRRKTQEQCDDDDNDDVSCREEQSDLFAGKASATIPTLKSKRTKHVKLLTSDPRAKSWTEGSRSNISSDCVLTELMPQASLWTLVPPSKASAYLPTANLSPPFTVRDSGREHRKPSRVQENIDIEMEKGCDQQASSSTDGWRSSLSSDKKHFQLELFESHCSPSVDGDDSLVFNAGGPVWAMDWCLQPEESECCVEYCAISTHQSTDETHAVGRTFHANGVIQLWSIEDSNALSAHMDVAIAHSWGCVWDLKWCPQSWQCSQQQPETEAEWSRLGVLAVSCSTGEVHLLSVPHPSYLKQSHSSDLALYHNQPAATLVPGAVGHHMVGQHGQAWCVCWRPDQGHSQIAAGFSDGSVAIWQIDTKCSWLQVNSTRKEKSLHRRTLLPIQQFQAHTAVVRSVCWSAVNTDIIVTAAHGRDASVRVWDLNDVSTPIQDIGQASGWVYEMQWLTYWNVIATAGDHTPVSTVKRHADLVMLNKLSDQTPHLPLRGYRSPRSSPYLSVSFSDWNNTLAFSCADGNVFINILPSFLSSLPRLDGDWNLFLVAEELLPESGDVSIVFEDFNMHSFSVKSSGNPKGTQKQGTKCNTTVLSSPLSAVNKVRWNPNYEHRFWLLSGCKSGLVRLTRVAGLQN